MRLIEPDDVVWQEIDTWGSHDVELAPLMRVEGGAASADIVRLSAGGILGRHPAGVRQLFLVVAGGGWVRGADDVRHDRGPGQGVVWEPGEDHASGSETGMTAVIIQASAPDARGLLAEPNK